MLKLDSPVESQTPHFFDPAQICARILRSDPEAERELVERFLPRVRTMLALRTSNRDAAEELGQEVMLAESRVTSLTITSAAAPVIAASSFPKPTTSPPRPPNRTTASTRPGAKSSSSTLSIARCSP
jgi:hypothetical protein